MSILLSTVGVASAATPECSQIGHQVRHLLAAERRPRPTVLAAAWIVDERMVPERGEYPGRRVEILGRRQIAGRLAGLAVERVAVQAALVDGQEDAAPRVAGGAEIADRVEV